MSRFHFTEWEFEDFPAFVFYVKFFMDAEDERLHIRETTADKTELGEQNLLGRDRSSNWDNWTNGFSGSESKRRNWKIIIFRGQLLLEIELSLCW